MTRASRRAGFVASLVALSLAAPAQGSDPGARREQARARLVPVFGSDARVQVDPASGVVRFAAAAPGRRAVRGAPRALGAPARSARAAEFLRAYGALYGVSDAGAELLELRTEADRGGTRIVYGQRYRGLPVFAGELRAHFDAGDRLVAVNGRLVPVDPVDTLPTRSADEAGRAALAAVAADLGAPRALEVREASLVVFREGFVRGTPGTTHLAWEVEVGDGGSVREAVFVDAHTGKPIDRISRAPDALFRRAYNALGQPAPGPDYPHAPLWVEGDPLPTGFRGADRVLQFSRETYEFFARAFGRDSFDGAGATLDAIFNRGDLCPNASWNGIFAAFCPGTITDDLTAHEWTHAYTDYTHDLIYQWQPGALNEAYSDIFGEVVDLLNGVEGEERNGARSAGECSESTQPPARIVVEAPLALAGALAAGGAVFNPASFEVTGEIALVEDGVGVGSDGCSPLLNAAEVAGRIALVDRGTCLFVEKVAYAQASGAVGVIVANDAPGLFNMAGADPTLAIPALLAAQPDGAALRAALASGPVRASLRDRRPGRDASERWLVGEDANAFGGAIRDAWNPVCHGDPGRVGEASYWCSVGDGGGVHTNSGVPNHAFALLADGGSYRGHTLGGIGLTRAAHVYFRAQSVYQFPASDFTDHADALEQSCIDLIGVDLPDLATGATSGEALTAADCAQVEAAVAAVELRTPPTRCGFEPLLAQEPPPLCAEGFVQRIFGDGFEHPGAAARFAASHVPVSAEFTRRDWEIVGDLPDGRAGRAFFAPDPEIGTCLPGGDESGVLLLLSPRIRIPAAPASEPMLSFEHWVATEAGWDGGNLEIRVNGGEWRLVEAGDFVYNAYNTTLFSAEQLNTNPMASEPAFSGTDGGTVDGSWGRSIVRLAPYAGPRDTIELRFRFGTDGCTGRFGWYVDDLLVYRCRDGRGPSESSSRER